MKRLIILLPLLTGCSLMHSMSSDEYMAYTKAESEYMGKLIELQKAAMEPKPLVTIKQANGEPITVYQQVGQIDLSKMPRLEQKRPSEWAAPINNLISTAGIVGGIYAAGQATKDLAQAVGANAGHNTTVSGSYNSSRSISDSNIGSGGNSMPTSGSYNQSNPITTTTSNQANPTTTTTTTTETSTSTETSNNTTQSNNPVNTTTTTGVTP